MEFVIVNGEFIERSEVKIDMEDRGYQFGDGVYEVIRVYNGKMFTANEHLNRLIESGKKIKMDISYTVEEMKEMLNKLIQKNNLDLGTIYMQITRGTAPRNHVFPGDHVLPTFVANTKEAARPIENMKSGVKTILNEDIRWLLCDIKSLNLLGNLMAKQKAVEAGCFEAIQHRNGTVTEGSLSNVLIVKDGKVITHPADNLVLNGITRQKVLEICRNNGMSYEETTFTLDDLNAADEVFISGTTTEVTPVIEIEGNKVGDGTPGPITKKLQELFEKEIEKECGNLSVEA
ncbi:D-amino-acid transaminase [Cytobacillus dafuensis]|uniref:D-alanine aminotransferase n=1 Tax=Cytobacillus dafuensis TaxID=1742359 RepID=A0A5B8Z7P3_CYTDA|nr:D-amino-acid transaminase [Cytobacillus dafuensis]QED49000.1 D-amino-acid transaminase [Cytobacillus dafuensis]